jgi:hypothetical protein
MNDRPSAAELIDAVRHYLETELLPTLTDARLRFQTLIAANVLAIVGRELPAAEDLLREEWVLLAPWVGLSGSAPSGLADLRRAVREANARLGDRIRAGAFDDLQRFHELAAVLRRTVVRKLEIANPRYLKSVT